MPGGESLKGWFRLWSNERSYLRKGVFEDEIAIVTYFTQREDELRKAVAGSKFVAMKSRVSTTNRGEFPSSPESLIGTRIGLQQLQQGWFNAGHQGLLGQLANAETSRRLVVTALALKRHALRHGRLPENLGLLMPGFLSKLPEDCMDGMPLRYRARADGGFLLYSVGLDCKDDGGDGRALSLGRWDPPGPPRDVVWPFPADEEEVQSLQRTETARLEAMESYRVSLFAFGLLQSWGLVPSDHEEHEADDK